MADEVDSGGVASGWAGAPATGPAVIGPPPANSERRPSESDDAQELDDRDGDQRGRIASGLVTLIGAVSLVCGLTWVLLNLQAPEPLVDLAAGIVLSLGGLVLLMDHRIKLPGTATGIAALAAGVGGTAAGIAVKTSTACCAFAYVVDRGFPFFWLQRGGVADDPDVAQRLAATDSWHVDVSGLALNIFIWAQLGVLLVALVVLARRLSGRR